VGEEYGFPGFDPSLKLQPDRERFRLFNKIPVVIASLDIFAEDLLTPTNFLVNI